MYRIEYTLLRLIRRWLLPRRIPAWLGKILPHYQPGQAATDPESIVAAWQRALPQGFQGLYVLEIGAGPTNHTARTLLDHGAHKVAISEPYAALSEAPDPRIERFISLPARAHGQFDLIVSYSVLEHVNDPPTLFTDLVKHLKPGGQMVHVVDYRDHFFKYPYHFLTFSQRTWDRWLNPGDLPRWRLSDHLQALHDAGWSVEVMEKEQNIQAFEDIRRQLDPAFDPDSDPDLAVTSATLVCTRL